MQISDVDHEAMDGNGWQWMAMDGNRSEVMWSDIE